MSAYLESELSLRKAEETAANEALRAAEERLRAAALQRRDVEDRIAEAVRLDPLPGDRWTEMYSAWCYVVERAGDTVTIQYQGAPCTFPEDAIEETLSLEEWRRKQEMNWPTLAGRGHGVSGWRGKAKGKRS